MSEKPISPLRQRTMDDMSVRNLGEKTRNDYIRQVKTFTAFLDRSPETAGPEDLRRFQLHETNTGVRSPTMNSSVAALRFFFTVTLGRAETARHLTFVREPRRVPVVLSEEEIVRLLEAAPGPKYKAALSADYGAGLRVSEVVRLKVSIDSTRMLLRIEQGKGRKDRFAMLSPVLLELLRDWYRIARPAVWLFPGRDRWAVIRNPSQTRTYGVRHKQLRPHCEEQAGEAIQNSDGRRGALLIRDRHKREKGLSWRSRVCSARLRAEEALRAVLRPARDVTTNSDSGY